jgi:hypothetical protein
MGVVTHTYNPSYPGGSEAGLRLAPGKIRRPYLKNKLKQKGLLHGSSSRVLASTSPEFKLQNGPCQKGKRTGGKCKIRTGELF